MLAVALAACAAQAVATEPGPGVDHNYNKLFRGNNATVTNTCVAAAGLRELQGTFVMPSLGQHYMGGTVMDGAFDAFGKLSRFSFDEGKMCFATRMMGTAFWNQSLASGTVAPALLFYETTPPRGNTGMANLNGANDNSYVNSYTLGGRYFSVTDSDMALEFDPVGLRVLRDVKWNDTLDNLQLGLGSAHPLPLPGNSTPACMLNVRGQRGVLTHHVVAFKICADAPETRIKLGQVETGKQLAYFHSFGLGPRHVILPLMHTTFDIMGLMTGGTVGQAFKPYDVGKNTSVIIMPLDGGEPVTFDYPGDVFFVHAVNAHESATADGTALVFDVTSFKQNPFLDTSLANWTSPQKRDASQVRGVVERWTMHLSGTKSGRLEVSNLSRVGRGTDFPKINPRFRQRKYCLYWAIEWWHDDSHFSHMAIVRQDVCSGARTYWHREGSFPSEPTMVPTRAPGQGAVEADAEDDESCGVVMFTLLHGESGLTSLLAVDAATMKTVSEVLAPSDGAIGYTTHGEWYPGL